MTMTYSIKGFRCIHKQYISRGLYFNKILDTFEMCLCTYMYQITSISTKLLLCVFLVSSNYPWYYLNYSGLTKLLLFFTKLPILVPNHLVLCQHIISSHLNNYFNLLSHQTDYGTKLFVGNLILVHQ